MSCSCRVAPMRTFIRGLAQVHKLDSSSPFRFTADVVKSRRIIAARGTRAFHGSRRLRQDAAAEAPAPRSEPTQGSAVAPSSVKESGSSSVGGSEGSGSKPAKKSQSKVTAKPKSTKPRTTKPKSTKPKTSKTTTPAKKPSKNVEGAEAAFSEAPPKQRKPREKSVDVSDKPPRKPRSPNAAKPTRPKKPDDGKMRDVADSILARRQLDESTPEEPSDKPRWLIQKEALKKKFPNGWQPIKKLSPDALAGIRALNAQFPDIYNVPNLAEHFKVSAENIRRILRSKWQPSQKEEEDRERRWHSRGKSIWEAKAALGIKPPKKWREQGITRDAGYYARKQYGQQKEKEIDEQEKEAYRDWRQQFNGRKGGIV